MEYDNNQYDIIFVESIKDISFFCDPFNEGLEIDEINLVILFFIQSIAGRNP